MSRHRHADSGGYWPIENRGLTIGQLVRLAEKNGIFITRSACELIDLLPGMAPEPEGTIELSALAADECIEGVETTTSAVLCVAERRRYRKIFPEAAFLLALKLRRAQFGSPYVVIMHEPVLVLGETEKRPRKRVLAICSERGDVAITAPRVDSEYAWRDNRIFIFQSPEPR